MCGYNHIVISQLFEELDTCNTGRITEEMFKELLHRFLYVKYHVHVLFLLLQRFGIHHSTASLQAVWGKILKNREGTVSHHEFIRHFGAPRLAVKCMQWLLS